MNKDIFIRNRIIDVFQQYSIILVGYSYNRLLIMLFISFYAYNLREEKEIILLNKTTEQKVSNLYYNPSEIVDSKS